MMHNVHEMNEYIPGLSLGPHASIPGLLDILPLETAVKFTLLNFLQPVIPPT
jgi:hypothetical protein